MKTAPVYVDSLRNYSDEQGLPQASVNSILQAHDGYLWMGTYGGLVRFDGQLFKTFHAAMIDSTATQRPMSGPGSERIVDLLEDSQQRLWVGTQDAGVSLYSNGRFLPLTFVCDNACEVMSMAKAQNGHDIWVLTREGVYLINPSDLSYKRLDTTSHDPFAYLAVTAIGEVYIGGIAGLARVRADASDIQYLDLPAGNSGLREMAANANNIWLVTDQYHLYRFQLATKRFELVHPSIPIDTHLFADNHGQIYISDRTKGTRTLADSGGETPLDAGRVIQSQTVDIDNEGNTWIGSPSQGLWRMRRSAIGLMAAPEAKMDGPGRAVSDDGKGGMWFGMGCNGLRHWTHDDTTQILMLARPVRDECISSLLLDRSGQLWIGSSFGFLGRLRKGQVQSVANWTWNGPLNIWQSNDGHYWVNSALRTYRLQLDKRGNLVGQEKIAALDGMGISFMTDSHRGGIWFVGNRGAYRIQHGVVIEKWTAGRDGVRQFRAIFEDDDGSLWIGTYGGGLLHIKEGKIQRFDESNGLFDNTISCILPDEKGRLWLAGNRGLTIVRNRKSIGPNQQPEISVLDSGAGLIPPEINGGTISACHRDDQGRLWFSMIRGFAMIDPKRFGGDLTSHVPITHIELIRINGHEVLHDTTVALGIKASNLEITYDSSALSHPELIRYRYRISKDSQDWIETGSNRTILMPTLPWGRFCFEVQAKSLGGPWSPPVSVQFDHPLPWYRYQSIWLATSIIALLGLLFMTRKQSDTSSYTEVLENIRKAEAERQREAVRIGSSATRRPDQTSGLPPKENGS